MPVVADEAAPIASLTKDELTVYSALVEAAEGGFRCPTADDLLELLPHVESHSTTVVLVHRLAAKGLIRLSYYQRGRQITVAESGKSTAEPSCLRPHWRETARG